MRIEIWNQAARLLSVMPVDMTGDWQENALSPAGQLVYLTHHCMITEAFKDAEAILDRETAKCEEAPDIAKAAQQRKDSAGNPIGAEEARVILADAKAKRPMILYGRQVLAAAKEEHFLKQTPEAITRRTGIPPLEVTPIPPTRGKALSPGQVVLMCMQHGKSYRRAQARGGVDLIGWPEILLPPPPVPLPSLAREGKDIKDKLKEQDAAQGTLL